MGQHFKYNHNAGIQRHRDKREAVHNELLSIQKKSLEVSDPDDAQEKEADEVARKVTSGGVASVSGSSNGINRSGEGVPEVTSEFETDLGNSKGGGQSLDDSTRSEMESKMDADFSEVKVHTGGEAHAMSESINAKAFTHGQDVYFKSGQYNPQSKDGKELLAHELTHTVQQGSGKVQPKIQRKYETDEEVIAGIKKEKDDGKLNTATLIVEKLKEYLLIRPDVIMNVLGLWTKAIQEDVAYGLLKPTYESGTLDAIQKKLLSFLVTTAGRHDKTLAVGGAKAILALKGLRRVKLEGAAKSYDLIKKEVDTYTNYGLVGVDLIDIMNDRTSSGDLKTKFPLRFFSDVFKALNANNAKYSRGLAVIIVGAASDATLSKTETDILRLLDSYLPTGFGFESLKEKIGKYLKGIPTTVKGGSYTIKANEGYSQAGIGVYGNANYAEYVPKKTGTLQVGDVLNLPDVRVVEDVKDVKAMNDLGVSLDLTKSGEYGMDYATGTPNKAKATPIIPTDNGESDKISHASGVTIGYGYDLKFHSSTEIQNDLLNAGIPQDYIDAVKPAAELAYPQTKDWIKNNVANNKTKWDTFEANKTIIDGFDLLLSNKMREYLNSAMQLIDKWERAYQKDQTGKLCYDSKIPFDKLNPIIISALTDMKYGGTLKQPRWLKLRVAILNNDVAAFTKAMLDDTFIVGGNYKRFDLRIMYLMKWQIDKLKEKVPNWSTTFTTAEKKVLTDIEEEISMTTMTTNGRVEKDNSTHADSMQKNIPALQDSLSALLTKYKVF